jgi:uncharacterized membrane protein YphA (DoxX/SURF4 family)
MLISDEIVISDEILFKVGTSMFLLMFFLSGIGKIKDFSKVSKSLRKRFPLKLPLVFFKIAIICVIILLSGGSSFILYSTFTGEHKKISSYIILLLIAFTIAATLLYHFPKPNNKNIPFWNNISLTGGFVLLLRSFIVDGKLF